MPIEWKREQGRRGCVRAYVTTCDSPHVCVLRSMSPVLLSHISDSFSLVGRVGRGMASSPHPALVIECAVFHGQLTQISQGTSADNILGTVFRVEISDIKARNQEEDLE